MDKKLQEWRDEDKHLPEFLKDFHDQKDFFKFLHEFSLIDKNALAKDINWMQGHAYSIDILLWTLSRFGWTLQRSRAKQNFEDLDELIKIYKDKRHDMFTKALLRNANEEPSDK